jgi:hypothetical protein
MNGFDDTVAKGCAVRAAPLGPRGGEGPPGGCGSEDAGFSERLANGAVARDVLTWCVPIWQQIEDFLLSFKCEC